MSNFPRLPTGPGAFRLFLATVVVIHHSFPLRLGAWAVYLFFILSGYWIAHMWRAKYVHTKNPLFTFYVSRWWRLAPVFLLCSILALCAALWLPIGWPPPGKPFLWLLQQVPIVASSLPGRLIPPAWSLDVEMQFYLAAPFLVWLVWRAPLAIGWLGIGATTVLSVLYFLNGGEAEYAALWPFLSLFLWGIMLARIDWRTCATSAFLSLGIFTILTAFVFLVPGGLDGVWQRGADVPVKTSWVALWWLAGGLMCLPFVAWNIHQPTGPWDHQMGNLAYPLYMVHWIPRQAYYSLVDWSKPAWWNALLLLGNVAVAFIAAIVILKCVDMPLDRLRARWVKSRLPQPGKP